jgi:hypothetical protein
VEGKAGKRQRIYSEGDEYKLRLERKRRRGGMRRRGGEGNFWKGGGKEKRSGAWSGTRYTQTQTSVI